MSKESRKAAREFTLKHKLSIAVENDLARLLESVWQDGVNAEQTFNLVEGMVKLVYATCRHCGHKFIPRVEQPRQCGNCWGLAPLRDTPSNKKNGPVSETRKKEHGK